MDRFMRLALSLANKADPHPNPRVGAVLVKSGEVIGQGFHKAAGMPHAEIEAMEDAKRKGNDINGATLYVSLEPCSHKNKRTPPCTKAIIASGIREVVYAMEDPNPLVRGAQELEGAGIDVKGPTDQEKAEELNRRYIRDIRRKPYVAIKMAMSADGKTATRSGDSRWISCRESREHVHRMRARFDAVMVGAGTVKKDDPRLTARMKGKKDPYRVIVDSDLCISMGSKVLRNRDMRTIVATSSRAPKKRRERLDKVLVCGEDRVDLQELVRCLGAMGIKSILIEGGSELNAAALEAGIVDKLYIFIAPKIIGGRGAKGVFGGFGINSMKEAVRLDNMGIKRVGEDILLEYDVGRPRGRR